MKAIYGEVVDLKLVRTRQVMQVVVEVPIEAHRPVVNMVGLNSRVLVTLANLPSGVGFGVVDGEEPEPEMRAEPATRVAKPHPGGFGQLGARCSLAVRWCKSPEFWEWFAGVVATPISDEETATRLLREHLKVGTRADLDRLPVAAEGFDSLRKMYIAHQASQAVT